MVEMYPPRAVFKDAFWEEKPLPPIEEAINQRHRPPGSLVSEHLETFRQAIYELADWAIGAEPRYTGKTPGSYLLPALGRLTRLKEKALHVAGLYQ
jgi:hypothetical protein